MRKPALIIFLFLISFSAICQDKKLNEIIDQLHAYYQEHPKAKIYLNTNKDVYQPGEQIWFNAWAELYSNPEIEHQLSELSVAFYNIKGETIVADNFRIKDGKANGDFLIAEDTKQGQYFLIAYTEHASKMNELFSKVIFIDSKDEDLVIVEDENDQNCLKSGKNNVLHYSLKQFSGDPYKGGKINYTFFANDKELTSGKLKAEKNGQLQLAVNLPKGEFRTPLKMVLSNNGKHLDYEKTYHVDKEKLFLRFYPEGGSLISGAAQKIGFRVTNRYGQPIDVQAELRDDEDTKISELKTLLTGYGVFPFQADELRKYFLVVTSELGKGQRFKLPKIKSEGLSLSIQKISDDYVQMNLKFTDKTKQQVYLLVSKGNHVFYASEVEVSEAARINLDRKSFPNGLSLISAFSTDGELLGKRMIYMDNKEGLDIQFNNGEEPFVAGKQISQSVSIKTKDGKNTSGNCVISVSPLNETVPASRKFESFYQINSELEYAIPLNQFSANKQNLMNSINYLLIANRFKNFSWNAIFDFAYMKGQKQSGGISGRVIDTDKMPVKNAKVSLVSRKNMQILTKSSDKEGQFLFPKINPESIGDYVVKVIGMDGQKGLKVEFEKSFEEKIASFIQRRSVRSIDFHRPIPSAEFYKENRLLFKHLRKTNTARKTEPAYKSYLQTATNLIDVVKQIKPFELMGGKIVFSGAMNSINNQDGALIVVDEQKVGTDASALSSISPHDVESIDVSTDPMDIQRYTGLNSVGVIIIKTKRGEFADEDDIAISNQYKDGFRVPNNFSDLIPTIKKSHQTALYWDANVRFDSSESIDFQIPTSKLTGKFLLKIAAIDELGRIGESSQIIEVVSKK